MLSILLSMKRSHPSIPRTVARVALVAISAGTSVVVAQPTPAQCDAAQAALLAQTTDGTVVEVMVRCPNRASVIRTAILATRQINDPAILRVPYRLSASFIDDGLANVALDIANDGTATEASRTFALLTVGAQVDPSARLPDPEASVLASEVAQVCFMDAWVHTGGPTSAPITAATYARVHTTTLTLFRNASLPPRVRRMAQCAHIAVRGFFLPPVLASDIQLTYLCGNRFRLRNRGFREVDVRWEVYNTTDQGEESIGAATPFHPHFDQTFTTELRGTVRVVLQRSAHSDQGERWHDVYVAVAEVP